MKKLKIGSFRQEACAGGQRSHAPAPPRWNARSARVSGDWTFFGVAKPSLGARASRPPRSGRRPLRWPAATLAGGPPALPGWLRQTHVSCRVSAFRQRSACLVTALHRPRSQQPKSRAKDRKKCPVSRDTHSARVFGCGFGTVMGQDRPDSIFSQLQGAKAAGLGVVLASSTGGAPTPRFCETAVLLC